MQFDRILNELEQSAPVWWHGSISRDQSMASLLYYPDNSFLIRKSSMNQCFSVDVICKGGRFVPILISKSGAKIPPIMSISVECEFCNFSTDVKHQPVLKCSNNRKSKIIRNSIIQIRQESRIVEFMSFAPILRFGFDKINNWKYSEPTNCVHWSSVCCW